VTVARRPQRFQPQLRREHRGGHAGVAYADGAGSVHNTATGYTGTVHVAARIARRVAADYSFGAGDAGVHTLSATLKTAGGQT